MELIIELWKYMVVVLQASFLIIDWYIRNKIITVYKEFRMKVASFSFRMQSRQTNKQASTIYSLIIVVNNNEIY